jgi:hypothetical protein
MSEPIVVPGSGLEVAQAAYDAGVPTPALVTSADVFDVRLAASVRGRKADALQLARLLEDVALATATDVSSTVTER